MERKLIFDKDGIEVLAKKIKKIRKEKKISQEELAYKSNLSLSQIARIETARINPTISTLFKIIRALEISPKELFDFELPGDHQDLF